MKKKLGLDVVSEKIDGVRIYRVVVRDDRNAATNGRAGGDAPPAGLRVGPSRPSFRRCPTSPAQSRARDGRVRASSSLSKKPPGNPSRRRHEREAADPMRHLHAQIGPKKVSSRTSIALDKQREACEAYITSQKAEGWIALAKRYDDGGYSGGTLERPALRRLLQDIEDAAVDVVVVYKIDRLSRSLMDFTKLVEVFDRRSVTFVSVTQSFNTTNSMGRLTLNVLLSFAQFEREVTGERIRDKFAASKKKGIWMGGNPALGYDVSDRKLVVNAAEAETVRLIFRRYLDLGCVRLLCDDLATRSVVSKYRAFESGETRGGKIMGRSALYLILNNRTYLGETTHKGVSYRGEHEAIVPRELFDAVRKRLAELAPRLSGRARQPQDAPYAGLLFDETGTAMLPTYSVKRGGIRYRYYASRPTLKGERSKAAISRIPAPPFEAFMEGVLARLALAGVSAAN